MTSKNSRIILGRGQQRGATVFIVLMAVMLLTSLGAWVVYASGQAALASGYTRMASQSLYVAEAGIIATTGAMALPGVGAAYYEASDLCESVDPLADRVRCKATVLEDLNTNVTVPATTYSVFDQAGAQGSLSAAAGVVEGSFRVEMADARNTDVGGECVGCGKYKHVVFTSYGVIRPPVGADLCAGASSQNSAAGRQVVRAHAIIGPTVE